MDQLLSKRDYITLLYSASCPAVILFNDHSGSMVLRSLIRRSFVDVGMFLTRLGTSFGVAGEYREYRFIL